MDRNEFPLDPLGKVPPLRRDAMAGTDLTETHQAILQYFRKRGPKTRLTFDEVAEATGLPHDVLHHHLKDLHSSGHVASDPTHHWLA